MTYHEIPNPHVKTLSWPVRQPNMNNLKDPPEDLIRESSDSSANDSKRKRDTSSSSAGITIIDAENTTDSNNFVAGSTNNPHELLANTYGLELYPPLPISVTSRSQSAHENNGSIPANNGATDPRNVSCSTMSSGDDHDGTNLDIGMRPTKRPSFGNEGLDPDTISYLDNAASELDDNNPPSAANANGSGTINSFRSGFDDTFRGQESAANHQSEFGSLGIEMGGADAGAGGTRVFVEANSNLVRNGGAQLNNTMQSTQLGNGRRDVELAAVPRAAVPRASVPRASVPRAPVTTTAILSADQQWDRSARTVFANLEAELTENNCSAYNTATNGNNDCAKQSKCKPISHGNAFANLEAELLAKHFPLSTSEELDSKPRAVSSLKAHNVYSNLEAKISHQNSSEGNNSEFTDMKPPAVQQRESTRMDTEPMQIESTRSPDGSGGVEHAASASVPNNESIQNESIEKHSARSALSACGITHEAIEQSRSVFANLEQELLRHEEEEHRRARAPIEYLTSSIGFSAMRRYSLSSQSSVTLDGIFERNNSSNRLNEMARVEEEPMDDSNDDRGEEYEVIANIEIINEDGGMNMEPPLHPQPPPPQPQPPQLEQAPAPDPLPLGLGSQRSRDIIASIEEDILRRQQEESTAEVNFNRMFRNNHIVIGPYSANLHPTALGTQTPNVMLNMMMMQQYRQLVQSQTGHNNLIDQISNMAMDSADDASLNSVASCVSYDGKSTNIFSIPCQTREQSMAVQMLNEAVNDLVNAPVMTILRKFPMLTRFVQTDDDSGDIQLHYAVRVGNAKAIRRILRVDPSCAMIRNFLGYCPLHIAAQIGNFSAVQLLCSLVPASAEVQVSLRCVFFFFPRH